MHNPYIEWCPVRQVWAIYHNGGIQAYVGKYELTFTNPDDAAAFLADMDR